MKRVATAVALLMVAGACKAADPPRLAAPHFPAVTTTTSTTLPPATTTTTAPLPMDDASVTARAITAGERDPAQALGAELGYRHVALSADPNFQGAVAAALPADLHNALTWNVDAVRQLTSLGKPTKSTAPPAAWTIKPVATTDELLGYYREASAATGVPWEILAAIHFVETKLGRVVGDSWAGAQGPMQFLPATWARYGQGDIHSNHDAILGAAHYLQANGAPSRLDDALMHYNPTPKYVAAVKDYAQRMAENPDAYRGYHEWQVLYRTVNGTLLLPEGWPAVPARSIAD